MRQQYGITVTSYKGSRHYKMSQLMRRFVVVLAGVVTLSFAVGFLLVFNLSAKLTDISQEVATLQALQVEIKSENQALSGVKEELQRDVDDKSRALIAFEEDMRAIESTIGIAESPEEPFYERFVAANNALQERQLMLNSLPSGYPVKHTKITSHFGPRKHPILGRRANHGGVDLRAKKGTPVYATADGVVNRSGATSGGLGKRVRLSHNFGFETVYAHLDATLVAKGDYVKQGDLIGYSGNTGRSSAPHLHYEVRHLDQRVSPRKYMDWSLTNYDSLFSDEDTIKWESLAKVLKKQIVRPEPQSLQLAQLSLVDSI
ncbi:MAG: peptidoglycan DD-metalloendopeptidase family protein [Spongiibacteraceae bacterium]